jgi:hypothetical protein
MENTAISGDVQGIARAADTTYRNATSFSFDDAQNGLKYALLRLSVLELSEQDRAELRELGGFAFQELEVTRVANQITARETASPLAVTIANIVEQSRRGSKKMAFCGAVFGAYAALGLGSEGKRSEILKGVLGAIAGAVAVTTSQFARDEMEQRAWRDFIERD